MKPDKAKKNNVIAIHIRADGTAADRHDELDTASNAADKEATRQRILARLTEELPPAIKAEINQTVLVVLNDGGTYANLGGCQLVMLLRNEEDIDAAFDLAALDNYEEGKDFRRLDLEKIVNDYLSSMKKSAVEYAVEVLLDAFEDVPEDFCIEGQSFAERVDGWVRHAVQELDNDIQAFEDGKEDAEALDEE
jgi:hypothetical protein